MFYIVEHDMGVNQIIDTKGKANKYGKAKLFDSVGDAIKWLSKHYSNSSYYVNNSMFGIMTSPFYEVKEATQDDIKRWR